MADTNKSELFLHGCAGMGIGVLVGLVAGLSISSVTSTILGALSTGLLVLLGLASSHNKDTTSRNSVTVAVFGVSCALMILTGVYIRSHKVLQPSLIQQDNMLKRAFSDPADRRRILLLENFGLFEQEEAISAVPVSIAIDPAGKPTVPNNNKRPDRVSRVKRLKLVASNTDHTIPPAAGYLLNGIANKCDYSRRDKFANIDEYIYFLKQQDPTLASLITSQPVELRDKLSHAISSYLCP